MAFSVKWFGHASFQITHKLKNTYIDPYQGDYEDRADLVLLTHSHYDHCDPSKIEKLRGEDTTVIAPADCAPKVKGKIKTLKPGERATVGEVTIEAVPAYNYKRFRSPGTPFHPKDLGVGYLMTLEDRTVYHAGDSDFIPEMRQLKNVCLALLPTGGTYTMDSAEAAEATLAINPEVVIPMHRLDADLQEFKRKVEGASRTKVVLLKPGEKYEIP
jgi:L-ascorbate metabolism protein UlaG (beta-lactamase superfamily)